VGRSRFWAAWGSLWLAAGVVAAGPTLAQTVYPSKPIRLVVPYPPGGPLDTAARALAERAKDGLGTIIVENRPGAGGNIGVDHVAKSAPDGYSLVVGAVATHAVNPWLFSKLPYDPIKDFAPITLVAHVPNVLVMTPQRAQQLNVRSARDLIDYARANPGRLNYASGGNGSAGHMAGELMKSQARLSAVHIPYAGAAPAQLGLLAGQTDFMFDNLASATAQIKAGRLLALAVTTAERAAALPDVPTMSESGLAGFDVSTWFGIFAPAATPAPVVARLNQVFTAALRSPEMRERLARMGAEPAPMSPQEFAQLIARELAKYEKVVRFSGARVD
jgi:tripartite-type tricarboxylate transporter receptor subunit TctC